MLKRSICTVICVAAATLGLSQNQGSEKPFSSLAAKSAFEDFVQSFTDAKSLKAKFLIQWIGKSERHGTVELTKPGMGSISTKDQEATFSGTEIKVTTLKTNETKTYPQDESSLAKVFDDPDFAAWYPFFSDKAFLNSMEIGTDGFTTRHDEKLRTLVVYRDSPRPDGQRIYRLYIDPLSSRLRQMEFQNKGARTGASTLVMVVQDLKIQS